MVKSYSYKCKDYPGMESCPGKFVAETADEVFKLAELHAVVAHGENPSKWSENDRDYLFSLIKSQ